MDKISPRHKRVAARFLANGGSKRLAVLAEGYSESYARSQVFLIFDRPEVREYIRLRQKDLMKKLNLNQEWVIKRLMLIADADLSDALIYHEDGTASLDMNLLTRELKYAIQEYTVDSYADGRGPRAKVVKKSKIKNADKLRALEMLARHLGMFEDKTTINLEGSVVELLQAGRERIKDTVKPYIEDQSVSLLRDTK